jgi:tRNA threonylcarbamoyl adenosine modification protein YeaZ
VREAPLILAIETSGPAGSTALLRGEEVLAEKRFEPGSRGGSVLHPGVSEVLAAAPGESPALVAVGVGPGSYTGTRIGIVFGRTFAFARGVPVVGVSALEAVALRRRPEGRATVVMAAHPGHVYGAVYECGGDAPARVVCEPAFVSREEFLARAGGAFVIEMPPEQAWASDVGRAAWRRVAAHGMPSGDETPDPLYLQAPAPERT